MFRTDKPVNYEEVYQGLAQRLKEVDFEHAARYLGCREAGPGVVSFTAFGRPCLASARGIEASDASPLAFTIRIVAAWYFLHQGVGRLAGRWVSYRDFKDGAFFHAAYAQLVEANIAQAFGRRMETLTKAAAGLEAENGPQDLGGDLCLTFPALPMVPLTLIFYDADDDFPASASVLFDESAPRFLDMECLAVHGMILADLLAARAGLRRLREPGAMPS